MNRAVSPAGRSTMVCRPSRSRRCTEPPGGRLPRAPRWAAPSPPGPLAAPRRASASTRTRRLVQFDRRDQANPGRQTHETPDDRTRRVPPQQRLVIDPQVPQWPVRLPSRPSATTCDNPHRPPNAAWSRHGRRPTAHRQRPTSPRPNPTSPRPDSPVRATGHRPDDLVVVPRRERPHRTPPRTPRHLNNGNAAACHRPHRRQPPPAFAMPGVPQPGSGRPEHRTVPGVPRRRPP
jgi:hypothetical protein